MKIGILTFHWASNYGAFFQTYALQAALVAAGHDVEIIDYRPVYDSERNLKYLFPLPPRSECCSLPRYAASALFASYKNILNFIPRIHCKQLFASARQRHLRLSPDRFTCTAALKSLGSRYDLYLAGSDQIWNPILTGNRLDPAYFLAFALSAGQTATYGASMSGDTLPPVHMAEFRRLLAHVGALSMRETSAARFVEQETGRPVVSVVDPTLLLDRRHWERLASPPPAAPPPGQFVLFYRLVAGMQIAELAARVAKTLQLPLVHVGLGTSRRNPIISYVAPEEFLWYFANARFVVSDSFHGAMFSVIFRKPFYAIADHPANIRVLNQLEPLGLGHRVFDSGRAVGSLALDMDFKPTESLLKQRQQDSLAYLTSVAVRKFPD